eukprot:COSAG01_NODE_59503_length_300_cov_0.507463_1_plen_46_part_10
MLTVVCSSSLCNVHIDTAGSATYRRWNDATSDESSRPQAPLPVEVQ